MNIYEFADVIGASLVIRMRTDAAKNQRFYAKFEYGEVKCGGILISSFGNGSTPDEAVKDYAREISGQTLVFDAYRPARTEYKVPMLEIT